MKQKTLDFLKELNNNNNKLWFSENKKWYEEAKKDFESSVEEIMLDIANFDENVEKNIDNCKKFFRINRDVRFSKDKSPYKTNFGGFITSGDRANNPSMYYIHLEEGSCGIAIGIYMPDNATLQKIRNYIAKRYLDLEDIILDREFNKVWGDLQSELKLKRPPAGFDAKHEAIEYLKLKSFTFWKSFSDKEVMDNKFVVNAVKAFEKALEFNLFLNKAIK